MNFAKSCRKVNAIRVSSLFEARVHANFKHRYLHSIIVPYETSFVTDRSYIFSSLLLCNQNQHLRTGILPRNVCSDSGKAPGKIPDDSQQNIHKKISRKEQLKLAVRDYGGTVIVFHVGISLMSLGICYLLISNGLDAAVVLKAVGFSESIISSKVAVGGSTFVIAYAVHKLFAPVRIGITLSATPFIVRYLRKVGVLKMPKS